MAAANDDLRVTAALLKRADLNLAASDEELVDWAKAKAGSFERSIYCTGAPKSKAVAFLKPYGIAMPKVTNPKSEDAYHRQSIRLCSPQWWTRQVRVLCQRHCEKMLREFGETRKLRGAYVSDYTVNRMVRAERRNRGFLKGMEAENDLGQVYSLADLAALGMSNSDIRRGELQLRMRGFQEWAAHHKEDNWESMFYTITCPSRFHAWHSRGGNNAKFDGSSPLDGQRYLCKVWARIRTAWAREGIPAFGFRVVEPHHDGTPHWHLLFFIPAEFMKQATLIMRDYACSEDAAELSSPKAKRARFTAVKMDPKKGDAAGYIAKYISKNIDGFNVGIDVETGKASIDSSVRVVAWARVWGIRQFQQIGGPPVTVWREARRLACCPAQLPKEGQLPLLAEQIIDSADRSQWARFIELMGGAIAKRVDRPMKTFYLISQELGKFGEQVKRIKGVVTLGFLFPLISRPRKWLVRRIQSVGDWVGKKAASPPLEYCQ